MSRRLRVTRVVDPMSGLLLAACDTTAVVR